MKYIIVIIIIFTLTSCKYTNEIKNYDYIPNDSIRIIRDNNDSVFLINKDNKYYLLVLNKENINIKVDYLIKLKDISTSIKYQENYLLDKNIMINDVHFKVNDKVEIKFDNYSFCIYINALDKDNYLNCDFLYLYNPPKNINITLTSNLLVLFSNSYTKFSYPFMYHLSSIWIDSYAVDNSSYLTITYLEDDFKVTSAKIKGKTIHKKENP